jgi:intein-encoded DNA endonuclease-like protein
MRIRKYIVNENYFDIWSPAMAYIVGFTTADGYIWYGTRGAMILEYSIKNTDISILEFIRSEVSPNANIRIFDRYDKRTNKTYTTAKLRIFSTKICRVLAKFGIVPNKTGKEMLPNLPENFKYDYLRGLIDGDGSFGIYPQSTPNSYYSRMSIASASYQFLDDINKVLLMKLGKIVNKGCNCYALTLQTRVNIITIGKLIYNTNSFYLNRKKQIFDRMCAL